MKRVLFALCAMACVSAFCFSVAMTGYLMMALMLWLTGSEFLSFFVGFFSAILSAFVGVTALSIDQK